MSERRTGAGDLVVYGAMSNEGAQCCDATLVSPLTRSGSPQPSAAIVDGAVLRVAERRKFAAYPELARGGPQKLIVLGCEVGGRCNAQARHFVRDLVRLNASHPHSSDSLAAAAAARDRLTSTACRPGGTQLPALAALVKDRGGLRLGVE